ncbi:MAG: glycosyltransferase family 4 protein [Actinomycetota bacterium]|nr:glycosyltransferase family 4 protein [Actinomycetota bacterium]
MLRVLLDATAVPANRGGVGRYVDGLIPALVGNGIDLLVACQPQEVAHYAELSAAEPVAAPAASGHPAARLIWEQTGLARVIAAARPDVVHAPHYTHAIAGRRPLVVTLHDATFFTDPQVHSAAKGPFFRAATKLALRRAACCIVPSQATADELVRVAGADPARLQVAHHGVDHAVFTPPSASARGAVRARLGLDEARDYVAFLGTMEPRKNIPALIRGWVQACAGRPDPPALVLAGASGWDTEVDSAIAQVSPALTLVRTGYLPLNELAGLLGGATVVAYPSLAEGFGLPVLEAMACGAPVLTTRRTAMPEIGGDAVAYTEPDAPSIAAALGALLDDPARRATLAAAALVRAAQFTWDACALAHRRAYERAAGEGPRPWKAGLRREPALRAPGAKRAQQ